MSKYINAEDLKKSFRDGLEKIYPLMDSESTRKLAIDAINGVCKDIDEFPAAEVVPRQNIEAAIAEIAEKHSHTWITGEKFTNIYALDIIEIIRKHTKI